MELLIVPATSYFKWPLDLVVSKSFHPPFDDSVSLKEWFLHERFARNLSSGYRYQPFEQRSSQKKLLLHDRSLKQWHVWNVISNRGVRRSRGPLIPYLPVIFSDPKWCLTSTRPLITWNTPCTSYDIFYLQYIGLVNYTDNRNPFTSDQVIFSEWF